MLKFEAEAKRRGWSGARLSRESGLNATVLYEIMSGDRNPRGHHMVRIAAALGVTPDHAAELFETVVE